MIADLLIPIGSILEQRLPRFLSWRLLTGATFLTLAVQVKAMTPLPPPDSGSLLQQNMPPPTAMPASDNTGLEFKLKTTQSLLTSAPFNVVKIEFSGNTVFSTATLHALVTDREGQEQTLQKLNEAVSLITMYYNNHGYPLAQAVIPAQTMRDGIVRVNILEARYGLITINNQSLVSDAVVRRTLKNLKPGQQVEQTQLDRSLLLLSDIPGVLASSVIRPGTVLSTSDLMIDVKAAPWWSGHAVLDDYGNSYTGRSRLGGTFNWFDPLNLGDVLTVNAITTGQQMDSLSLSYETQLNGQGLRGGSSVSALHYILGESLSKIGGHGTAEVVGLWLKYPWYRSRDTNVNAQLQLDEKKLDDRIDTSAIETKRNLISTTVNVSGDTRDNLVAGAISTWSLTWKVGQLHFDNFKAQALDATTAKTQGGFVKWTASFDRLQYLNAESALFAGLLVQYSTRNLDSAEKMVAGGVYSVRAYDMGAISADRGVSATIEFRQNLPALDSYGQWQAVVFADAAHMIVNNATWTNGLNSCNLFGAGVGLNWLNSIGWHAKLLWATPVGSEPALISGAKKARVWVEMGAWF